MLEREGRAGVPWPRLHFLPTPVPFLQATAADRILEAIKAACIPLDEVVLFTVDTWHRTGGGAEENSNDDTRDRLATAQRILDATGGTLLNLAHPGKGREDTRGGGSAEDDADAVLRLERPSMDTNLVTVKCAKQRDAEPFAPWTFRLASGLAVTVSAEERVRECEGYALAPGTAGRAVLFELAKAPATTSQLQKAIRPQHGTRSAITALHWLEGKHLVQGPPKITMGNGRQQAVRGGVYTISPGGQLLVSGWIA